MQFSIKNTKGIKDYLNELYKSGAKEINIKEVKDTRSLQANKLYWKWLSIIANETGDDANSLHELFKVRFLGKTIIQTSIGKTEITQSTAKLNIKAFYNYMLKVDVFASSFLNIDLPRPTDELIKYIENIK